MDDDARSTLQTLCSERGESYAGLSRLLDRNDAYIQQYLRKGTPRRLPERERRILARYFGVAEAALGGPAEANLPDEGLVSVMRRPVRASAGPGRLPTTSGRGPISRSTRAGFAT